MFPFPVHLSRRGIVASVLAIGLLGMGGAAYASGAAQRFEFYACETANGLLGAIATSPPNCAGNTTLVHFALGQVQDGSVTTAKLADNSVTSAKITNGSIQTDDLADRAISTSKLSSEAVTTEKIGNAAVTTLKLDDRAVTDAKVASGIDGGKITEGSVRNAQLAGGIDGSKLTDGTVSAGKIAGDAITSEKIADGTIADGDLGAGSVTHTKIANGHVSTAKLRANARELEYGWGISLNRENMFTADTPTITLAIPGSSANAPHQVLIAGQAQVFCSNCGNNSWISWRLREVHDGDPATYTEVGFPYTASINADAPYVTASFSHLVTVVPGQHKYHLTMQAYPGTGSTGATIFTLTNTVLHGVDLGRR